MTDASILFRNALQTVYGQLDWLPVADGAIHRFHVPNDKPGTVNGWYVLYWDGIASAAFGSWKAGGKALGIAVILPSLVALSDCARTLSSPVNSEQPRSSAASRPPLKSRSGGG